MRTIFVTEFNKMNASKSNGVDLDDVYKPSMWHLKKIMFLKDHVEYQKLLAMARLLGFRRLLCMYLDLVKSNFFIRIMSSIRGLSYRRQFFGHLQHVNESNFLLLPFCNRETTAITIDGSLKVSKRYGKCLRVSSSVKGKPLPAPPSGREWATS